MFSAESEFANGGEFTVPTGTSDGQSALMRGQGVLYSRTGKYGNADDKLRLVASADKPGFNVRVALIFFLSTYALTGGVLALVGWATNRPRLTDWIGHGISIFPNTAIACICLGLAVLVRLNRATWSVVAARGLALCAAVLGAATLAEHILGVSFGIDTLLFYPQWGQKAAAAIGRMGPPACASLLLLGTGLCLLTIPSGARRAAPILAIFALAIAGLGVVGYLFKANLLFSAAKLTGISLPTATIVTALALAILASAPDLDPLCTLRQQSAAGRLARRSLSFAIFVPIVLGWLFIVGRNASWFDRGMGTALLVLSLVIVLCSLLWWSIKDVRQHEMELDSVHKILGEQVAVLTESREGLAILAAVVESSDDAIITKNLDGIITTWNKGAERIFGYTATEVVGKPILILIPQDRHGEEPEILARVRRGERVDHFETVRQRKDGTLLDISLTISPVRNEAGEIIGASKIARDVTELLKARQLLEQSHQELEKRVIERTALLTEAVAQMEEFSYSVSHDLRAPIRAMQGYAKATLEDYGHLLDPHGRDYLVRIVRSGERMDRLVRDILTYSRITRADLALQPVNLDTLVRDILSHYPEMQEPKAAINLRGTLGTVLAHEPSLAQAISNLLSNAVKFVAAGVKPNVQVYTEKISPLQQSSDPVIQKSNDPASSGFVRLLIQDNGIGVNPEHQGRLFGLFQRIHPENVYQGTGVGLAVVRKAVERMGGRVGMESNGNGSRFWLELPAGPAARNVVRKAAAVPQTDAA